SRPEGQIRPASGASEGEAGGRTRSSASFAFKLRTRAGERLLMPGSAKFPGRIPQKAEFAEQSFVREDAPWFGFAMTKGASCSRGGNYVKHLKPGKYFYPFGLYSVVRMKVDEPFSVPGKPKRIEILAWLQMFYII